VKKPKKQRADYPSTNVSSPVLGPQQTIRRFAYEEKNEDDAFDAPRHPMRKQKASRGYENDGFVVNDDDFGGDFPPVRVAKGPKNGVKAKGLGHPITTDERVAELDDNQVGTFIDFMEGARKLRKDIMAESGLRGEPIFNDIVLQEIGLELPTDLDEMRAIPGIRSEMVDRHGRRFLLIAKNSRRLYMGNPPTRRHLQQLNEEVVTEDDEDEVMDPNHVNIIDLCSEGEEAPPDAGVEESESNYFDSDDDDDDDDVHISHHFTQNIDPDVVAFNDRMTELGPMVPKATAKSRAPASRGGSKVPGSRKPKTFRRSGSGNFKNFSGVKKKASRGSSSRASAATGATKKAPSGGRKGGPSGGGTLSWPSVMAMPT
jgi:bloom syndrome protein